MRQHCAKLSEIRLERFESGQQQFADLPMHESQLSHTPAGAAGAFDRSAEMRPEEYCVQWHR